MHCHLPVDAAVCALAWQGGTVRTVHTSQPVVALSTVPLTFWPVRLLERIALRSTRVTVVAFSQTAFEALERGDLVLGPATDGGYYLIGLHRRALDPFLFRDIPWSTPQVLAVTVDRCRILGLASHQLAVASDVDTPEDLERLRSFADSADRES